MTKRPRRWLKINGKINVLGNHMEAFGYTRKKVDSLAKKHGVMQSLLPLKVLSDFFGAEVKEVDQPSNWQEILYGSKRGAQRYVPKGKAKGSYAARKAKELDVSDSIKEPVRVFCTSQLTRYQLETVATYY